MSSKMSSKRQIKRSKEKRSQDKMDKAMNDVKKIGIISCCLIAVLIVIGIFINTEESYAAVVQELPEEFTSVMDPVTGDPEDPPMPADYAQYIEGVSTPKAFYGIDTSSSARLSNIYCMDRKLIMSGGRTYKKDKSVIDESLSVKYPGLIYIIEHGDTLPDNILNTKPSNEQSVLIYYINQIVVWWYLDIVNGYSSGPTDVGRDVPYDEPAAHQYENNLTVAEKTAIINDNTYGPYIAEVLTNAMAYNPGTTNPALDNIDTSTITYTMTDEYIETSPITVTSNAGTNFVNYTVSTSNNNIQILNESGVSQTTLSPNERFKLRIPVSEVKDYKINLQVSISGNFSVHNAYFYVDSQRPSEYQRALLGQILDDTTTDSLSLSYEIPTGEVIISKQNSETGARITGAVLSITDKTGKEVYRYETTNNDMDLTLPVGTYTITETVIPEGYNAEVTTTTFEITEGETTEVVIENTPTIDVPNTSLDSNIVYIIGAGIIVVGIILIVVAMKSTNAKKKK